MVKSAVYNFIDLPIKPIDPTASKKISYTGVVEIVDLPEEPDVEVTHQQLISSKMVGSHGTFLHTLPLEAYTEVDEFDDAQEYQDSTCRRCRARNVQAGTQRAEDGRYVISVHHKAADLYGQEAAILCVTLGITASQCHMLTGRTTCWLRGSMVLEVGGGCKGCGAADFYESELHFGVGGL
eukprot:5609941-Amphidinium_carterae.2